MILNILSILNYIHLCVIIIKINVFNFLFTENSEKYNDILRKLNKISQNQEIILETLSKICNEHSLKACKMSETNNVEDDVLNSGMPFKQWNEVELFEKKLESKSYFKNIVSLITIYHKL